MPLPPPPNHLPPSPPRSPGVLTALIDTRFNTLVTPTLVTWIYRGCTVAVVLMTLWWMLISVAVMTWPNGWMWGVLGLVAGPVIGLVLLLIVRVMLEVVIIRFRQGAEGPAVDPAPHGPQG